MWCSNGWWHTMKILHRLNRLNSVWPFLSNRDESSEDCSPLRRDILQLLSTDEISNPYFREHQSDQHGSAKIATRRPGAANTATWVNLTLAYQGVVTPSICFNQATFERVHGLCNQLLIFRVTSRSKSGQWYATDHSADTWHWATSMWHMPLLDLTLLNF